MSDNIFGRKVMITYFGRLNLECKEYVTIEGGFKDSVLKHIGEMAHSYSKKDKFNSVTLEKVSEMDAPEIIRLFKKHTPFQQFVAQLMENPTSEEIESTIITDRDFLYFNSK